MTLQKLMQSKILKPLFCTCNPVKHVLYCQVKSFSESYEQGQSPERNIREYFYYIDHQGMLFLDDTKIKNFTSCFKDHKFLVFFFTRLRINDTGRYGDFPYLSLCGRERNFVRCDDFPVVYTHVAQDSSCDSQFKACYGHAGDNLHVPFEPQKLAMSRQTGRVYHPAPEKLGGVGLIRSSLAIDFSRYFTFKNSESEAPTHFSWNGIVYDLVNWCDSDKLDLQYKSKNRSGQI